MLAAGVESGAVRALQNPPLPRVLPVLRVALQGAGSWGAGCRSGPLTDKRATTLKPLAGHPIVAPLGSGERPAIRTPTTHARALPVSATFVVDPALRSMQATESASSHGVSRSRLRADMASCCKSEHLIGSSATCRSVPRWSSPSSHDLGRYRGRQALTARSRDRPRISLGGDEKYVAGVPMGDDVGGAAGQRDAAAQIERSQDG